MLRAVLDANIYVGAVIRPQTPGQILERFLRESAFEIILSPPTVDEVLEALTYPKDPETRSSRCHSVVREHCRARRSFAR